MWFVPEEGLDMARDPGRDESEIGDDARGDLRAESGRLRALNGRPSICRCATAPRTIPRSERLPMPPVPCPAKTEHVGASADNAG